jgi:hypothetical protein
LHIRERGGCSLKAELLVDLPTDRRAARVSVVPIRWYGQQKKDSGPDGGYGKKEIRARVKRHVVEVLGSFRQREEGVALRREDKETLRSLFRVD